MPKVLSSTKKTVKKPARKKQAVVASVRRPAKRKKITLAQKHHLPDWVSLENAAQKIGYVSVPFLEGIIGQGKLKAFKIGDEWLTTHQWIEEYKNHIKSKIDEEIKLFENVNEASGSRWIATAPKRNTIVGWKIPTVVWITTLVLGVFMTGQIIFTAGDPDGARSMAVSVEKFLSRQLISTNNILLSVSAGYELPLRVEDKFLGSYLGFLDSGSEKIMAWQISVDQKILSGGKSLVGLKDKKFNDERLTQKLQAIIKDKETGDEMTIKDAAGQVAGAMESGERLTPSDDLGGGQNWLNGALIWAENMSKEIIAKIAVFR